MAKKKDAAAELAEKMLPVLQAQSRLGPESYPLTAKRLGELTDAQAPDELLLKALGKKPFKDRAVVANKESLDGPIALGEDTEKLAASPLLLEFVLKQACAVKPTCPLARLKAKVDTKLKQPFENAVKRQVEEKTLPSNVECIQVGRTKHLHPLWMKLPKKPEIALAERLMQVLIARRRQGGDAYPARLDQLLGETGLTHTPTLLRKAVAGEPFKSAVVMAAAKFNLETPVVQAEDRGSLITSRLVLEFALKTSRKKNEHAFAVQKLAKSLTKDLQPDFKRAIDHQMDTDSLPAGVGWLWNKDRCLLLLQDVHGHRAAVGDTPLRPVQPDFEHSFDNVFRQLNQQSGSHNFISLVDLRRALPLARDIFDAGLRRLRQAGRYSLSAAEGRHGISADEREAGILEDGTLLLYVSRRAP